MTNASKVQWSARSADGQILVVGGETSEEFFRNAVDVLGPDAAQELENSLGAFVPDAAAAAVATVKDAMPGSVEIFAFKGTPAQGQRGQQGYITDRWGTFWHPERFDQAPPCQCQGSRNQGKLALKIGKARATGKEFTAWFCANTFEGKASDGCEPMFNNNYPSL